MVIATTAFEALARAVAARAELPEARIAVVEHPLGGISAEAVLARAAHAVDEVVGLFTQGAR